MLAVRLADTMNLYRELLREQWDSVSLKVKNSHLSGEVLHAQCCLDVVGSSNLLGKIISRMVSFPAPMKAANVDLHIRSSPDGEIWERVFPDRNLRSVQSRSPDGYLVDRFGIVAFLFRLEILHEGILHNHIRTYLKLGIFNLRLPMFMSPRIVSHEEPDSHEDASRINVSVFLPMIGHLLTYSGIVRPVKENS